MNQKLCAFFLENNVFLFWFLRQVTECMYRAILCERRTDQSQSTLKKKIQNNHSLPVKHTGAWLTINYIEN